MKTIIYNGSPRKNGTCGKIIRELLPMLSEYRVINAYEERISACIDCRYCRKNDICAINDDMQQVYNDTALADTIIIVSPVYHNTLTGPLLSLLSRFQLFFTSRVLNKSDKYRFKTKRGILILSAGGSTRDFSGVISSAEVIFKEMGGMLEKILICRDTDKMDYIDNKTFCNELEELKQYVKDK